MKTKLLFILCICMLQVSYAQDKTVKAIKAGKGKAELTTVAGGKLWAMLDGNSVVLMDEKGGKSRVTIADVRQSNGIIHVIDSVLLPR